MQTMTPTQWTTKIRSQPLLNRILPHLVLHGQGLLSQDQLPLFQLSVNQVPLGQVRLDLGPGPLDLLHPSQLPLNLLLLDQLLLDLPPLNQILPNRIHNQNLVPA